MPYYGQINYPQQLGTGNQTIATAGCFLDSFVNLLNRWGEDVNPLTLNQFFIDHNTFIYDADDKGADDLSWSSISQYDPNIVVQNVGGATLPTSNDAIVEFHYNSVHSGLLINHFCLVDHIEGDQLFIVDSYDGIVKGPGAYESVYHKPVAWASYVKNTPVPATPFTITDTYPGGRNLKMNADHPRYQIDQNPVTPMGVQHKDDPLVAIKLASHVNGQQYFMAADSDTTGWDTQDCYDYDPIPTPYVPPSAPVPVKLATQIPLVVSVPVYVNAHDADVRNVEFKTGEFPAGMYYQFGVENGMVNIGITNQDTATVWMNPLDNVAAIVPPVPETVIEPQVDTSVPELDPEPATETGTSWKQSYIAFYPSGTTRITRSIIYDVKIGGTVTDFGGTGPTMELTPGSKIGIYGKFYGPDGVHYYRPRIPKDTNFDYFYGIPISYNGRAILTLPAVSWLDKIWHKGMVLKSIFTEEEPRYIDSVLLKAFKRRK